MAERPPIKSRQLTRDDLAQFLPNPKLIRAFELITEDVTVTLPDAIAGAGSDADNVLATSSFSPPQQPDALQLTDTASPILAAQIFGG